MTAVKKSGNIEADRTSEGKRDETTAEKSGNVTGDSTSAGNGTAAAAKTSEGTENMSGGSDHTSVPTDAAGIRSEDREETDSSVSEDALSPYEGIAISVAEKYVKIYQKPDAKSKVLGKLYGGSSAKVLRLEDGWVKLRSGKVTGYAKTGYLAMGADAESVSEVSGQYIATVKKGQKGTPVYEDAGKDSVVLKKVKPGTKWRVTGENGAWTEIQLDNGSTGFIASERIEKKMQFEKAISIAEEKRQKARAKKLQEEALLLAKQRRESILAGNAYSGNDDSVGSSLGADTYAGGTSAGSASQRAIVSYAL